MNPGEADAAAHPVFASLATDEGLEQLLPYLVALLEAELPASLGSLPKLRLLLRAAESLVANRSNNLEAYLHQLLPCVMTCLVAKRLGGPRASRAPPLQPHSARLRHARPPARRLTAARAQAATTGACGRRRRCVCVASWRASTTPSTRCSRACAASWQPRWRTPGAL